MGMIYKRGKVYWIKYYRSGKPFRESTKSYKAADAKRLLKKREGEIANGKKPGVYFDKVTFDELSEGFLLDYRLNNRKSLVRAERSVNHLKTEFEGFKATEITTLKIQKYIEYRLEQEAANASINRELSALKRMFRLGAQQTPPQVDRVPYIPMLKENNIRKGFFEHAEFKALIAALPDYLKGFCTFGCKIGWRVSEISALTWNQVDREQGIVRLEPGETKNDEGRTVYLDDELKEIFNNQWEARKRTPKLVPYVFPNIYGTDKIKDIRGAWNKACRDIGLGYGYRVSKKYVSRWEEKLPAGPLFHDFRRTAIRNMVRSEISEKVAMMISGHKTRSVFDRYNIVNAADLQEASKKQEAYLKSQIVTAGTITGTIHDINEKRGNRDNG